MNVRKLKQSASGIGLAVLILLSACGPEPPPVLRLGYFTWPGYEPFFLAAEQGYFGDAPIRLLDYSSTTQVQRALRNGTIEAACLTLDEALLLSQQVRDLRIVLVLDSSEGADVILAQPGIRRMADLRGRRIGLEGNAVGAYLLSLALEQNGLKPQDLRQIPIEADRHERAFREGQIDAVVTIEPHRSRLLAGGAQLLFDSRQIPGGIVDVLVVRQSYLDLHPDPVRALLRGWLKSVAHIRHRPEDSAHVLGVRLGLTSDQVTKVYRLSPLADYAENQRWFAGTQPALSATAERVAGRMVQQNLLKPRTVEPGRVVDGRIFQSLEGFGGVAQ